MTPSAIRPGPRAGKTVLVLLAVLVFALSAAAAWWLRGRTAPRPQGGAEKAGESVFAGRPAELLRGAGFTVADRRTAAPPLELSDLDGRRGDVRFAQAD